MSVPRQLVRKPESRGGFTLIELMISIAILAILAHIQLLSWQSLGSLAREKNYRFASKTTELVRQQVLEMPYNSIPPRLLTVDQQGRVSLGDVSIVPDTLTLRWTDGSPAAATPEFLDGELQLPTEWAGRDLIVDYRFLSDYLPGQGDAHTIPVQEPYQIELHNVPVLSVSKVWLAKGKTLELLPAEQWQLVEQRHLLFPAELAGRAVVVDYKGDRVRTEVSGSYLDAGLEPQLSPSEFKRVELKTNYGGRRTTASGFLRVKR